MQAHSDSKALLKVFWLNFQASPPEHLICSNLCFLLHKVLELSLLSYVSLTAWVSLPAVWWCEGLDGAWQWFFLFVFVAVKLHLLKGCLLSFEADLKKMAMCLMPSMYKEPFIIDEDILFQETLQLIQVKSWAPFSRPCSAFSPTVMWILQSSLHCKCSAHRCKPRHSVWHAKRGPLSGMDECTCMAQSLCVRLKLSEHC